MSRLPVVDLARRFAPLRPEVEAAVARVLESGVFLLGPETEALEAEVAAYAGRRHAVVVASATEGLCLALRAVGVTAGDDVLVPAFTAVPTAAAVCLAGARPRFVDVDPDTATVPAGAWRPAHTDRTAAAITVHLYGRPAEVPDLDVPVIEDAAQALGSTAPESPSVATVFSFYPTKNLGGVGDGGAVVTDDADLATRVRTLRHHGMGDGYVHHEVAGNARLSEIEAAVLRVALPHLDGWNERRRKIAAAYRDAAPGVQWQAAHERHSFHLCVLRAADRDAFRARMPFDTAVHYPLAMTQQPAYQEFVTAPCPEAEAWAAECVTLPCFPEMTDREAETVAGALT